jgi:hypothetical protein
MSQNNHNQRATLQEWQVAQLRLTAFPAPLMKVPDIGWWENVIGQPPELRTFRPKSEELLEEGPFEAGKLTLNIQPLRIDWNFARAISNELLEEDLPTIGEFPKVLENFFKPMQKWLSEECPELGRLAFGAVLFLPVESRQAGYKRLSAYLPAIKLDPEESSDFLYQINRLRNSNVDIDGLRVNRLSKWSVFSYLRTLMHFNQRTGRSEQVLRPEVYACRLELDINTTADFIGTLSREKLTTVFEELIELGREIIEKGDIP